MNIKVLLRFERQSLRNEDKLKKLVISFSYPDLNVQVLSRKYLEAPVCPGPFFWLSNVNCLAGLIRQNALYGELHMGNGSFTRHTLQVEKRTVRFNQCFGEGEAKPGSLPRSFTYCV